MSRRRFSPSLSLPSLRALAIALCLVVLAATLPALVAAQGGRNINHTWQLLLQRPEAGAPQEPPRDGLGGTMSLRSGSNRATIEGACSTYETTFQVTGQSKVLFTVEPDDIAWRECDEVSEAFDRTFYENLSEVSNIAQSRREAGDSVLILDDELGEPVMTLTRARIDEDPSAVRWDLARIGGADGSIEKYIEGAGAWMEFLPGDKVVGSTGCGSFLGTYTTNQNALAITDVAARLVACTDGLRVQAERTLDTLGQITDFQVGPAGLALRDGQFTRLALVPPVTAARGNASSGTTDVGRRLWTPIEVLDGNGGQLRAGQELSTTVVQFGPDGVEGLSICGPFRANALRSGLAVTVSGIQYNESACKNPKDPKRVQVKDVEADFLTALEATASYALRGSELELKDVDGATRIRLVPQPPLEGPTWVVDWIGKAGNKVKGNAPTLTFADLGETHTYQGQTGAGANEVFGLYRTPRTAQIEISNMQHAQRTCRNEKQKKLDACKQEAQFLQALRGAKAFVVREEDMRLLGGKTGTRVTMLLRRQVAGGDTE